MLDGANTDIHNDPYLIGIDMKKLGESLNAGLIDTVLEFSKRINDGRGRYYVLAKCQEELGELSTEVAVAEGDGYKTKGKDGVVGEAMDAILAILDLIYIDNPDITKEELIGIAIDKCTKWENKVIESQKEETND